MTGESVQILCAPLHSQVMGHMVSGSDDQSVPIWNMNTGDIKHIVKGHSSVMKSVAILDDRTHVISGSDNKSVQIWNAVTWGMEHVLEGHSAAMTL